MASEQQGTELDLRLAKSRRRAARLRRLSHLSGIMCVMLGVGPLVGMAMHVPSLYIFASGALSFICFVAVGMLGPRVKRAEAEVERLIPGAIEAEDARVDAAIAAMEREQAAESARPGGEHVAAIMTRAVCLSDLREADFPTTTFQ
jgi:hypothetical protein